ncbi:MAG TPA: DUF5715 family protein [Granulicella sp.]|nr:DUF5715 family protein [Granulicella sp.]
MLPSPLLASHKHKSKPHKPAHALTRTAPARRKPRIIIPTRPIPGRAALGHAPLDHARTERVDRATAERVHAFIARQHSVHSPHRLQAHLKPLPAAQQQPPNVITVARHTAARPEFAPTPEFAATPVLLPTLYNKRGRLIVPPPLKGSREILLRQNEVADRDGLTRIQNDADLERMRREGLLVALPVGTGLQVDERLPLNRRYCRPWTADFLAQLSREFYARFQTPLQVNSAVRTVEFQEHLIHINGNAAPAEGDTASPHLTGQAVDIAKHGLSLTQIAWLRGYLLPLVQESKIDVEEEFQQACFHISVYKSYVPQAAAPRRDVAALHSSRAADLAVSVR